MRAYYGGHLPVYAGTRYQRGGGILSSVGRFLLPAARTLLTETLKAAPRVVDNIVNKRKTVKSAIFDGLKTAGANTVKTAFNIRRKRQASASPRSTVLNKQRKRRRVQRGGGSDIFS